VIILRLEVKYKRPVMVLKNRKPMIHITFSELLILAEVESSWIAITEYMIENTIPTNKTGIGKEMCINLIAMPVTMQNKAMPNEIFISLSLVIRG
jgi:hypothetical protein